jgi:hypothetical protein
MSTLLLVSLPLHSVGWGMELIRPCGRVDLFWYLMIQAGCGIFLKTHVFEGTKARRAVVLTHGFVGKTFPVVGWTQMIFGGIAALGFCFGEHFGQCLAHFIVSWISCHV